MTEQEYILTYLLDCSRADLYLKDFKRDARLSERMDRILARRKIGEPIQYLIGSCEFMGLNFKVDKQVLIPRPETEILAEEAIKIAQNEKRKAQNILDIGTGSGNIAIFLAKFLPESRITAIDISSGAIELAKENAILNNVASRIEFAVSDLFSGINKEKQFDLIVSNPPYIRSNDLPELPVEVKYEPQMAMDGGKDGLDFYCRIIKDSPDYLKKDGIILMEMGYNQSISIQEIFNSSGNFEILQVISDYSRIERVIIAQMIK